MKDVLLKYGSRKFVANAVQCGVLVALPILYKKFEISDEILMTVLVATSSLVGAYTGFNVLQKKLDVRSE
jgi:hypothetical protein